MIPGLAEARFARYGQMHRNTFLNSPRILAPDLRVKSADRVYLAGQLTGVEGYLGNIATGLLAGLNVARAIEGGPPVVLPPETMLGSLVHYVTHADPGQFQPMKANLGLLPELGPDRPRGRRQRAAAYAQRAQRVMAGYLEDERDLLRIAT
jgi:methylenetetrahydrofolate--tRNA-(uracil-5-)-methyltransferase